MHVEKIKLEMLRKRGVVIKNVVKKKKKTKRKAIGLVALMGTFFTRDGNPAAGSAQQLCRIHFIT